MWNFTTAGMRCYIYGIPFSVNYWGLCLDLPSIQTRLAQC